MLPHPVDSFLCIVEYVNITENAVSCSDSDSILISVHENEIKTRWIASSIKHTIVNSVFFPKFEWGGPILEILDWSESEELKKNKISILSSFDIIASV